MSCYIPYADLESTLYAAYRHDFNKYKDLSAVVDSVMSLSVQPEAKIHAIWFYSGFINSAAYNVLELQTPEWSRGVYSSINNYLKPFLTGEKEFDFDSIVQSISEFLAKPIEVESEGIEDSILSDISDTVKLDDSELTKLVSDIIERVLANKSLLDPAILDPNQTKTKTLLDLLFNAVSSRKASSTKNTALNIINNSIGIMTMQQNKSMEYVDLANTIGIGIANGVPIQILRRANGSQLEVTYDRVQNKYLIYDPESSQHQQVVERLPGDQIYNIYGKNNISQVDPNTLNLRMHRDEILTGLIMEERFITGSEMPVQDEMSQEALANTSFYSYIKVKANTYSQQLNAKRLARIQKIVPQRQFETKERPNQNNALATGTGPILTYIRPTSGFTITVSNFKGDKSFDIQPFSELAFVYPDNTVVKVDFDNLDHIELLKANMSTNLNVPSWRSNIKDPKYVPITDSEINEFKLSVERYRKFSEEVQKRINDRIEFTGNSDVDIRDIFFKYYDITNNVENVELVEKAKPVGTLGEYIEKNDGELPVTVQYYDEDGNLKGEPVREKLPIVLRKTKNVWEMFTVLPEGKKLVGRNGKQYRDVLLYLEEGENVQIRQLLKNKFNTFSSVYIGFRTEGNQLKPVIAPLLYQKQAQSMSDVADIVSSMQYTFKNAAVVRDNTFMVDFNNKGWGFDVGSKDGIRPEIVILSQKGGKKTFGIKFTMLSKPDNQADVDIFNSYANENMNIVFNDSLLYGSDGVFTLMNEVIKAADVTIPENADLNTVANTARKAIEKLGNQSTSVIALKNAYRNLVADIRDKFNKVINDHDINLSQGKISRPLITTSFREFGLFDDKSLKLYKRGIKEDMLSSFYSLNTLNNNKLNLTYRDPAKSIVLPVSTAAAKKIDISAATSAPVVVVPETEKVEDPSNIAEPGEFIDPGIIPTNTSNIPFSLAQSLEAVFTLSDENLSSEIEAMKALIPGTFEFTKEGFDGLNVDGHVLGYVQGLMIHINNNYKAKGVVYHEGFHAIFRNLLDTRQQSYYLSKAREVLGGYKTDGKGNYIQVGSKKVYANDFRKERRYLHLNDEQIQHLIYEEYLADSFADFMETNKSPKTWMEKLFVFLKKLVNYFKKGGRIDNLFYDISLGKFRNATLQESKSNVETVYSIAYNGMPVIQLDQNNKPIKNNVPIQSYIPVEVRDKMIYNMAKLKGAHPGLSDSEIYDKAREIVLSDYNVNDLVSQNPSRADEIRTAYHDFYQNARWMLGTLADGTDSFVYSNLTRLSQYDNKTIDPTVDKEQVAINKAGHEKFKDQLLKDFKSIYLQVDSDIIDEELLEESLDNFEKTDEEIGESFKDVSFASIAPGEGTAAFRKLFQYIAYQYTDPRFGITRTKMVDSKLIFSTLRKITANLPKENIVSSIIEEVNRLDALVNRFNTKLKDKLPTKEIPDDIAKKIDLRDSLNAVLDTLSDITNMDQNGNPMKNKHIMYQFMDVFNTVDIKLMQIEMLTTKEMVEEPGTESKKLKIVSQDITFSDIVIWGDIDKIRGDIKNRLISINMTAEQIKPYIEKLNEINTVFRNIDSIKDSFFTQSGKFNDEVFENFIDDVYVNLSAFNLNIPYDAISVIFAYNIYKLTGSRKGIFSDNSKYGSLLKANKIYFKDFDQVDITLFSSAIPNVIKKSIELNAEEKIKSEDFDKLVKRVSTPFVNGLGEFILKYDPTIAGSVTRNANGDKVNKYVKPTPAYQTWIKLHNAADISEGLDGIIQDYFIGFEEYFEANPILNTDNAVNRFFLENFNVYAFAGFQQKFAEFGTIKEGAATTFSQIDDRAYLLSMLGMFTQLKTTKVPDTNEVLITFPRILNQYEATSTSLVVDAKYTRYFSENGKALRTKAGTPLFVNDLVKVVWQEYNLMQKNFKEFKDNSAAKLYKDYNVNPEKDRGFKFNILADFFESRPDLRDDFIDAARNGMSAESLYVLVPDVIDQLELQLEEYGKEQFKTFLATLDNVGIVQETLPNIINLELTSPESFLREMFFNNWINGIFVNQLFDGPIAVGIKGPADYFKRQKAGAAAGSNIYIPGRPKKYRAAVAATFKAYINNDDLSAPVQFTPFLDADGNVAKGNKEIDIFDGQTVNTVERRMRVAEAQGSLDPEAYMYLHRMKYITVPDKLYREGIQKLADKGIVFNSLKTVSAAGLQYIKQSEHTLIRKDVSHLRPDLSRERAFFDLEQLYTEAEFYHSQLQLGNNIMTVDEETGQDVSYEEMYKRVIAKAHSYFVPNKGKELLHNMLNSMEMSRMDQLMDTTASKRATVQPINYDIQEASTTGNYYFDLEEALEEIPNDLTYVQVSTEKVATTVTKGIQQQLLAITQLDPNSPEYAEIKKDIDNYQQGLADAVRAQTLWTMRLLTSGDKNVVSTIYTMIADGLREQGADSTILQWFELEPDERNKYNPNLSVLSTTLAYYYFSIFNKGIFDKKIAGRKYYHISPLGYKIIEHEGKIITQDEYKKNPGKYRNATTRYPSITKLEDGRYVAEVIVPKELQNVDQKFLEEYLAKKLFFGTRIPTEDKRSMMVIKIVDYIDEAYGAGIVVPYQLHMLSGSDFDIDALYAHIYSSYISPDGTRVAYGDYTTYKDKYGMSDEEAKFVEYLAYISKNSMIKPFLEAEIVKFKQQSGYKNEQAQKFGEYFGGKINDYFTENSDIMTEESELEERKEIINNFRNIIATFNVLQTLKNSDLPTTPSELAEYTKVNKVSPVVDLVFNRILESKVNILSNEKVFNKFFADPKNRADAAAAPYEALVKARGLSEKELYAKQNMFTPTALIVARSLNAESKDSLGISASFNKGVSMLASIAAKLNAPIGTIYLEDESGKIISKIDTGSIVNDSVQLVGGAIGMFADAPKNPYPGPLNLNSITTPVMLSMFAVGIPQDAAIMFQSMDPIVKVIREYNQEFGSFYSPNSNRFNQSFATFLNRKLTNIPSDLFNELVDDGVIKFKGKLSYIDKKSYKLIWTGSVSSGSATDIGNLGFKLVTDNKGLTFTKEVEDFILLNEFSDYQKLGADISFKITAITDAMKSLKPDQDRFDRLRNTYRTIEKDTMFSKDTIAKLFERYPVLTENENALELMNDVSKQVLMERTSFMKGLTRLFEGIWEYRQPEVRKDLKAFIQLQLQRELISKSSKGILAELYSEQLDPMKFISGDVVADWYDLYRRYPNNTFLKALKPVTEGRGTSIRMLETTSSKFGSSQKDQIFADVLFLMGGPLDIKEKTFRIAYHGMIKSGAQRARGGFYELLPAFLSKPMSNALDDLQKDLIDLDKIADKKSLSIEQKKKQYNEKLNEVINKNFGNITIDQLITDAVTKLIGTRLMNNPASSYKRTVSLSKVNARFNTRLIAADVVSYIKSIAPGYSDNIITETGTRPALSIPAVQYAKADEIELFTPTGNKLVLDFSASEGIYSGYLDSAFGIRSTAKGNYIFPLYRTNIYGQMLVLKSIDGSSIGQNFLSTLSETIASPIAEKMELSGKVAEYEVVAQQGTPKISPLAFTNQEAVIVRNLVMGLQQVSSVRTVAVPKSFNIVRTSNRAYEIRSEEMPSGNHSNKTFTLLDMSTITTGAMMDKYKIVKDKLYRIKNNVGNGVLINPERYDSFAQVLGSPDWQTLNNDPKFKDFLAGKNNIFIYDLISGDPESPTAAPITPAAPVTSVSATPEFDKLPAKSATPTMTYAGIGSRRTPEGVLKTMTKIAKRLENLGYTLRSGGAVGADTAFEKGATKKQIFYSKGSTERTRTIAKEIHPAPTKISGIALDLMARNTNQIFGENLDTPVDFVIAWTPDGAETSQDRTIETGGTGQAIDMASRKGIPVINLANPGWENRIKELITPTAPAQPATTPVAPEPVSAPGKIELKAGDQVTINTSETSFNVTLKTFKQKEDIVELSYINSYSVQVGYRGKVVNGKLLPTESFNPKSGWKRMSTATYINIDLFQPTAPTIITSNDKIIFGHPTIGKSYLKDRGNNDFISLDDDFKTQINEAVKEIAKQYKVDNYQVKDGGNQPWNDAYNVMMQKMFDVAKQKAFAENKTLFTSNTNLLKNNLDSFDKVINITDQEFERRIKERQEKGGAKYDIKQWKAQINEVISKVPSNKLITTDKYLSDVLAPTQSVNPTDQEITDIIKKKEDESGDCNQ